MLTHHALTERVIGLAIAVHKELGPGHSVPSADRDSGCVSRHSSASSEGSPAVLVQRQGGEAPQQ